MGKVDGDPVGGGDVVRRCSATLNASRSAISFDAARDRVARVRSSRSVHWRGSWLTMQNAPMIAPSAPWIG